MITKANTSSLLILATLSSFTHAATITDLKFAKPSPGVIPDSAINYAVWGSQTNDQVAAASPTATKAGGIGVISTITNATGTGNVRGTNNTTAYGLASDPINRLSYGSVSNSIVVGVFSPTFENGNGVALNITNLPALAAGLFYEINVWGSSFRSSGLLTASTDAGATSQTITATKTESKSLTQYTFNYSPDDITERLDISLVSTNSNLPNTETPNPNPHVVIQAVDIRIIPEISSSILSLLSAGLFILRRRRA